MNVVDAGGRREFEILTTLAEGGQVTQRALAARLGIALGLANLYLKRLARKGYIKVTTIPPHRVKYLVTPRGFAQKSRLTYEYMRYSLRLYREARQRLREALAPVVRDGVNRIALYGTGEAAELAYLTLREFGVEPIAVFDERPRGRFLGLPVEPLDRLRETGWHRIVVASFEEPSRHVAQLTRAGAPLDALIFTVPPRRSEAAST